MTRQVHISLVVSNVVQDLEIEVIFQWLRNGMYICRATSRKNAGTHPPATVHKSVNV